MEERAESKILNSQENCFLRFYGPFLNLTAVGRIIPQVGDFGKFFAKWIRMTATREWPLLEEHPARTGFLEWFAHANLEARGARFIFTTRKKSQCVFAVPFWTRFLR